MKTAKFLNEKVVLSYCFSHINPNTLVTIEL